MTVTLELKPEVEARLRARAAERGLPLKKFLEAVIEINVGRGGDGPFHETATAEEWEKALREWGNISRPSHPTLSEEAISREGIYGEREDSQL